MGNLFSMGGAGGGSFYPYKLDQSARFDGANTKLTQTFGTPTSTTIYTLSLWVKKTNDNNDAMLLEAYTDGSNYDMLELDSGNRFMHYTVKAGVDYGKLGDQLYRDMAGWYHYLIAFDLTQASQPARVKRYINGVELTDTYTIDYGDWPQNYTNKINQNGIGHTIGYRNATSAWSAMYLSEYHFVDGQQLTPSDFGTTKQGVWVPIKYTGTYGNNGCYLDFSNSSHFGEDQSGNNNDWTDTGFVAADQVEDSPTNNYCTLNPLVPTTGAATLSNGLLTYACSATANDTEVATFEVASGKWYWEVTYDSSVVSNSVLVGVMDGAAIRGTAAPNWYTVFGNVFYYSNNGVKYLGQTASAYGATWTTSDVIGIALDCDAKTIEFFKNNTSQGVISSLTAESFLPAVANGTTDAGETVTFDFGQLGFTYTPPVGFKALCSANLPTPLVPEGNRGFEAVAYEGTGAEKVISSLEFSPDFVWIKSRDTTQYHLIEDTDRGATNYLITSEAVAEATDAQSVKSFDSNGFTLGTSAHWNTASDDYIAWCLKENPLFGFDIVGYEGTGVARTVAHSLGVVPEMIIVKNRTDAVSWQVYVKELNGGVTPEQYYLNLDLQSIESSSSTRWNDTAPTSSVFSLGTANVVNGLNDDIIAYLFASVEGFSKVGAYTGNAAADGPYVYCGFRPRYVLVKNADSTPHWYVVDSERSPSNVVQGDLYPNLTAAEAATTSIDILSNGFKVRATTASWNGTGQNMVYLAFAEHPFKYANAR
jgi:hypothetical protein